MRPKPKIRKAGFKAQWTVEQLWRNPFKEERRYKTDGVRVWTEYVAVSAPASTGVRGQDFGMKYRAMTVDLLLRYTDLPPAEVASRSGVGTLNNLYLTCKREWGVAPMVRRKAIQKKADVGCYR